MRATLVAVILAPVLLAGADGQDWPSHDRDPGGQRHSPLTQITAANAATLQTAWTFDTGAGPLQATPLMVGGMLYMTGGRDVFALEPETGKLLWTFTAPATVSRRGVSYWPGEGAILPRIFTGSGDRLLALDAKTGKAVAEFGESGSVDLVSSIRGEVAGGFSLASPPAIYKNMIITGGNNGEQAPSLGLYGDIRAWDARTGKLLWSFHTVPRAGEPGVETWEGESWKNRSGTNMWSFFTIDESRGLLFAPIGSPTSDYYGGDRKGKNLHGNSIVALDITSGKLKWHQQLVHHDLWDYDVPSAPTLFEVKRNGRSIPALGVITKMSTLFIFNRETGEPVYGLEERPVPQSDVPGEASWPTQPFPLKPPPLARTTFDPKTDFNTLTPDVASFCKDLWDKNGFYTKGMFTPAGTDGYMVTFPSTLGGGNWNGLSYLGKDGRQYVVVAAGGGSYLASPSGTKLVAFALPAPSTPRKHVLAWADVRNGYQHEAISHAMATIERLGRASGLYDTYIRTDSQLVTKHPITFKTGTGIATGEQFLAHNLNYFDAIFFFGVREIDLTDEQKADLASFVKDDGKGFVVAHSGSTAFFSWPEFGDMIGGRFDEHPWGIIDATVIVDDPAFPAMQGFPRTSVRLDEHYQLKDFSRDKVRVLAHLDPSKLDLKKPLVHRTDGDFPVAWARAYGKGRVFYSTLGHVVESWDDPVLQKMYFNALRWALGLAAGDAAARPGR